MNKYVRWGLIGAATLALAATGASLFYGSRSTSSAENTVASAPASEALVEFAAPGRVEGLSDTTNLGAAVDGVLKSVYVQEGQLVAPGTLLAEMDCDDLKASLQTATAEADSARDSRARLLRGARPDERRIAAEKSAAARAVLNQSKLRLNMQRALYERQEISKDTYQQAERDYHVALANLQAALFAQKLLAAPPLPEDLARADANVAAAEGRVKTVQAQLDKCSIVAPIQGTILKVYAKPGESYSTVTPRPLFSIADVSGRRIKAEVDESYVEKLSLGQDVIIQADALGPKRLSGRVVSISPMMGRSTIDTGDPSQKIDRDTLEAVIHIDGTPAMLPIGLRVTVQFLSRHSASQ